ncbi:MAG: c-type cytochrome domain-containing protein [Bacteroidota bacterium]
MEASADWGLFLGRFHPLWVHLPIGMLIAAATMEILGRRKRFAYLLPATGFMWTLSAAMAIISAGLGWLLSQSGDYDGSDTLAWHKWSGIILAALLVLVAFFKQKKRAPKAIFPLTLLSLGLLTLTGHQGGELTHGSGYLVRYAPHSIKQLAGYESTTENILNSRIVDIEKARLYEDIIEPIFAANCRACHQASKKKGGLRMDSFAELMKGGKNGPVVQAGLLEQSEIFHRITLPEEDEKHMPPDGKRPLRSYQQDLIAWWIESGAGQKTVAEVEVPAYIQKILDEHIVANEQGVFDLKVEPVDESAVLQLKQRGALVREISQDMPLVQLSFVADSQFADRDAALLLEIAPQLTWLDVRHTELSDFSFLEKLPHLSRLHLEHSQVKDQHLSQLTALPYLEYLNLFDTDISDAGLEQIAQMKNLKSVYLWQTKTTEAGLQQLRESRPDLQIISGLQVDKPESTIDS